MNCKNMKYELYQQAQPASGEDKCDSNPLQSGGSHLEGLEPVIGAFHKVIIMFIYPAGLKNSFQVGKVLE